jgi:RNA polymerase sigma-70 factor (ECF subfamily)
VSAAGKNEDPAASKRKPSHPDALPEEDMTALARRVPVHSPPFGTSPLGAHGPTAAAGPRVPSAVPDRALQDLWVLRLRARDGEALREVVHAFSDRLAAVVSGILRDRDAVEDVVQETFTKAWLRIGSFQGDSGLYTWLYRVAVNACKDHLKRTRRRPAGSLEEVASAVALPAPDEPPVEGIERREARRRVRAAIAALPPKFRVVLALREIEGMPYQEIARVLSLSLGTVESRLFRARRRLKAILESGS